MVATSDDNALQAAVSGGLNTVSGALLMPPTDSPSMNNVDVLFNGNVAKRPGLVQDYTSVTDPKKIQVLPIRLRSGLNVLLSKEGKDLILRQGVTTMTKANVFGSAVEFIVADTAISTEPNKTRVIYTTGLNIPVQATLLEVNGAVTVAANSFTILLDSSWQFVTNTNVWVWVDGAATPVVPSTFTWGASGTTIGVTASNGSHTVVILAFTWQWWAEGVKLRGNQVIGHATQGASDLHVPTPEALLDNINEVSARIYPIKVYSNSNYDTLFTLMTNGTPTTNAQYAWSLGEVIAGSPVVPAPDFITFGATPGAARAVVFHRSYLLPFNGFFGSEPGSLSAYFQFSTNTWYYYNGVPTSDGGAATGGTKFSFWLRNSTFVVDPSAGKKPYIGFDATSTANGGVAVPEDDFILIADTNETPHITSGFIGSNAKGSTATPNVKANRVQDGYPFAIFGISFLANYLRGSFPRTCCVFQGRLVLGGFPLNPMAIAASNPYDSSTPGEYYNDYQIELADLSQPANVAFDIVLAGSGDDTVTAVREFQNQLFIWTRNRIFRVTPATTLFNVQVNTIAQVGCVNARAITTTDRSLFFLSQNGVFAIVPTDRADGYTVEEVSTKIRNILGVDRSFLETTGWMIYDNVEATIYLGVSDKDWSDRSNELFVYNVVRQSWSRYTDYGGHRLFTTGGYVVYTTPTSSSVFLLGYQNHALERVSHRKLDKDYTADFDVIGLVWAGNSSTVTVVTLARDVTFTTIADKLEYDPADIGNGRRTFKPVLILDYQDLVVKLNGSELAFKSQWYKSERGTVVLMFNPLGGNTLTIEQRMKFAGEFFHPVVVRVNQELIPPTLYTATITGSDWTVQFNKGYVPAGGALIDLGIAFPAWHYSPTFTRGTLLNAKRISHYAGYYNNEAAGDLWKVSEVGTRYDLLGTFKKKTNLDIVMLFNELSTGEVQEEIYGSSDLTWDEAELEVGVPASGYVPYTRTLVPIVGNSYAFTIVQLCYSPNTFQLAGYQIKARLKPGRLLGQ
jgi:hypothetical protein